ncbi:porimin [Esox lucius]|uniref:porimin n=1 Tax=Esox lucius TaxID=8010 RepID=UPI0014776FDA|nr:porimin [Esox lucius]
MMDFNALQVVVAFYTCVCLTCGSTTHQHGSDNTSMSTNPGPTVELPVNNRTEHSLKTTKPTSPSTTSLAGVENATPSAANTTTTPSANTTTTTTNSTATTSPPNSPSGPSFHMGSFLGGMVLAFLITMAVITGYNLSCLRRDVRYHTLAEEHDAII